jgi:hypothetical protein
MKTILIVALCIVAAEVALIITFNALSHFNLRRK